MPQEYDRPETVYNPHTHRMEPAAAPEQEAAQAEYQMPYIPETRTREGRASMSAGDRMQLDNLQTVRKLLSDPNTTDSHRQRLEGIVQTQRDSGAMRRMVDPKMLKKQQTYVDDQMKRINDLNMNRSTALTTTQMNDAMGQVKTNAGMAFVPAPLDLWSKYNEQNDPTIVLAKNQSNLEQEFGQPKGSLAGYVGLDKEGNADGNQALKLRVQLSKEKADREGRGASGRAANNDFYKAVTDRMKTMQTDPELFDQRTGEMLEEARQPWGMPWESVDRVGITNSFNTKKLAYEQLGAYSEQAFGRKQSAAGIELPGPGTGTPDPAPAAAAPMFTRETPMTSDSDEDLSNKIRLYREQRKRNPSLGPFWVRMPVTGELVKVN